jgi:hypothetical protein
MCVFSSGSTRRVFGLQHAAHYQVWMAQNYLYDSYYPSPLLTLMLPSSTPNSAIAGLLLQQTLARRPLESGMQHRRGWSRLGKTITS